MLKSMWPGVSIRLICVPRQCTVVAALLIVMPRWRSCGSKSITVSPSCTSPMRWFSPVYVRMRSVVVVLPASTWAMMPMLRNVPAGVCMMDPATIVRRGQGRPQSRSRARARRRTARGEPAAMVFKVGTICNLTDTPCGPASPMLEIARRPRHPRADTRPARGHARGPPNGDTGMLLPHPPARHRADRRHVARARRRAAPAGQRHDRPAAGRHRRALARPPRARVPRTGAALELARIRRRGHVAGGGPARARPRRGRPRRHLVAEPLRMGGHAVRHRAHRR